MTIEEPRAETKSRLLQAACEIFSRKGFRKTTVAEICAKAEANIAAVNYHFGGKKELYVAAWRRAFEETIRVYPFDGGVPDDAPAEERLGGIIESALHRFMDEGRLGQWSKMLVMELAQPTGILGKARHQAVRPLRDRMHALMLELLGERATDHDALLCGMSIMTQVIGSSLHMQLGPPEMRRKFPGPPDIDILSEHITRFALGGVKAVREQIKQRAKDAGA